MNAELNFATRGPLLSVSTASWLLGLDARRVADWTESGRIAWAWDLSRNGAQRREIRIWRSSVAMLMATNFQNSGADMEEDAVLVDVLPRRDLWGYELRRRFDVDGKMTGIWVAQGLIRKSGARGQGPEVSVRVDRESLVEFLRARRIGCLKNLTTC